MTSERNPITFELLITTKNSAAAAIEVIKEVLIIQGVELDEIVQIDECPFVHLSVFFRSYQKAVSLRKKLRKLRIRDLELRIIKLRKKEWFGKWKTEFKPFLLTGSIRVIPSWMKETRKKSGAKDLFLDTGFAFGSGMHPTTRFMAQIIERCRSRFATFLDIGTGSGILSLVAAVNGAQQIEAVDISSDAVRTAKANLKRNGFNRAIVKRRDCQDLSARSKHDLVAANLITQDLIVLKRKIVSLVKKGKYLAVSGISINNLPLLKDAFRPLPLRCLKIHKGEGWCAILYKKL